MRSMVISAVVMLSVCLASLAAGHEFAISVNSFQVSQLPAEKICPDTFVGPGLLQLGPQSCFTFAADSGESFFIENTGQFVVGDYVYVSGEIVEDSLLCWPVVGTAIENNAIAEYFTGSGTVDRGPQNCTLMFHSDDGRGFMLDDFGDFLWGDRVYVTGPIDEDSLACWPVTMPTIEENTIVEYFEGCGTIQRGPQNCILVFHSDDGRGFVLDDFGDFFWGDRVLRGRSDQRRFLRLLASLSANDRRQSHRGMRRLESRALLRFRTLCSDR